MEIGLILVVALIVIGPKKLPEIAGQIARTIRELQRTATEFSREITTPVNDLKRDLNTPIQTLKNDISDIPARAETDPYKDIATQESTEADASEDPEDDNSSTGDLDGYANIDIEEQEYLLEEAKTASAIPGTDDDAPDVSSPVIAPELPEVRPAPQAIAYSAPEDLAAPDIDHHDAVSQNTSERPPNATQQSEA